MLENALKPAAILFREEQLFAPWIYAVLGLLAGRILFPEMTLQEPFRHVHLSRDPASYAVLMVLAAIIACFMRMVTEVSPAGICISFGWLPVFRILIRFDEIQSVEACQYRPLVDTLGWGIRRSWRGETVLSARGNQAVRIQKRDGNVVLIGSQQSAELASVIESTRRSLMI